MSKLTFPLIFLTVLSCHPYCFGEEVPQKKRVQQAIAELGSKDFDTRDSALKVLMDIGEASVPSLKAALKKNATNLEFVARASRVIKLYEGGSSTVNGLKIRVSADKKELRPGEQLILTTTLSNTSSADFNLYVGYSTSGVAFESGATLKKFKIEGKGLKTKRIETQSNWTVGFCGTGAGPLFISLPAKSTKTYQCAITLTDGKVALKGRNPSKAKPGLALLLGKNRYSRFDLDLVKTGEVRLRFTHAIGEQQNRARGFGGGNTALNKKAKYWVGTAYSNDVRLKIHP